MGQKIVGLIKYSKKKYAFFKNNFIYTVTNNSKNNF